MSGIKPARGRQGSMRRTRRAFSVPRRYAKRFATLTGIDVFSGPFEYYLSEASQNSGPRKYSNIVAVKKCTKSISSRRSVKHVQWRLATKAFRKCISRLYCVPRENACGGRPIFVRSPSSVAFRTPPSERFHCVVDLHT